MDKDLLLQQLLDTTREGFWLIDKSGLTLDLNQAMCQILGRERDDVLGHSVFDFVDAENRSVFEREIERRKQGQSGPYEISLLRGDGSLIPCVNNATPIYDQNGEHIGSVGLWTDISSMKVAYRELEQAKLEAETANRAKSIFLGSMSHELRTPLNALLGYAQLMELECSKTGTERAMRYIAQIVGAGKHLLELIEQLLDLSRIEQGRLKMSMESFDSDAVVVECVELIRPLADERNIRISLDCTGAGLVNADHTRLRQVLLNLLSNAVKYNKPGGSVRISTQQLDDYVRFEVSDTGPGIAPEFHDDLFEQFNRLFHENSSVQGAGVGLMICRELVKAMNGQIGVESDVGQGSRFFVDMRSSSFEAMEDDDEVIREQVPQPTPSLDVGGKVLYVEDNPTNQALIEDLLSPYSPITLIIADDAEGGLKIAREDPPDLVLMDIHLPGMDGIEALRRLREHPETRDVPVVALTAAAMQRRGMGDSEMSFNDYMTKPIEVTDFFSVLKKYLPKI